jgi:hypothetical protein
VIVLIVLIVLIVAIVVIITVTPVMPMITIFLSSRDDRQTSDADYRCKSSRGEARSASHGCLLRKRGTV